MLIPDQFRLVLIDFGLAKRVDPPDHSVAPGENPVGGQTQWSPEKAASEGYNHKAEVWAAVCVFIHCVRGCPPWVPEYAGVPVLHFVVG